MRGLVFVSRPAYFNVRQKERILDKVRPYRVLVFEDDDALRKLLWEYFDSRKYEVFTFPNPKSCALCDIHSCNCPVQHACADIIISDLNMPFVKGLDFLEQQIKKGCKVRYLALMSGYLTEDDSDRAKALGIKLFEKPFRLTELYDWAKTVEEMIPDNRLLTDWHFVDKQ
jgi:DNA-binding response OmpR family regulator